MGAVMGRMDFCTDEVVLEVRGADCDIGDGY